MKKIFLFVLPLALFFVACEEIGLGGLKFDYDYSFNLPILAPIAPDSALRVETPITENKLSEELASRDITFVENIVLKSLTLRIPDSLKVDYSYIKAFSAELILDGKTFPLKFVEGLPQLAEAGSKEVRLKTDPSTPDFAMLQDIEKISMAYSFTLNKFLNESFTMEVVLNTTVETRFLE